MCCCSKIHYYFVNFLSIKILLGSFFVHVLAQKTESEIETNTLKAEMKIRRSLKQFKVLQMFMLFIHHIKC